MNEFKPNLSFNQEWFGSLYLNDYSIIDPFKSQILSGNQPSDLIKLCGFSSKDKWTLLYRGTRDGFEANDFHSKCDDHPNTLTIIKASGTSFIFGGFTSVHWYNHFHFYIHFRPIYITSDYKSDSNAFLFSLTNRDNQPCKMRNIKTQYSIFCYSKYGPIFGANDVCIVNNGNLTADSYSILGRAYEHPQPSQGNSFLAGSYKFQLSEIEVYEKE